jgi:hypothetical protein
MSPTFVQPAFVLARRAALARRVHPALVLLLLFACVLPQLLFAASDLPGTSSITITGTLPSGVATEAYSGNVKASGGKGPYVYHATSLPRALSISTSTGRISGKCNTAGTYTFTVTALDSARKLGTASFTVVFAEPPVSVSVSPKAITVPSLGTTQFTATVLYTTNTAVTWTASAGTISSSGLFTAPTETSNTSVAVTATSVADSTKSATAAVTVLYAISLTGNIPTGVATFPYSASVTAVGGQPPYVYHASSLPPGLKIDSATGAISGTSNSIGTFAFSASATDSAGKYGSANFSVTLATPPVLVSLAPKSISVPSSSTKQFSATVLYTTNTAVTWTASAGTIDSSGVYTAPIETANTPVTVTATSVADTTKSASSAVTVLATIVISGNIPTGVATLAYSASVSAAGGTAPYTYHATNLPKGLSLDTSTGAITGICATVGTYSFSISVTDSVGKFANATFSVTFTQPPVAISIAPGTVTIPSGGTQQFLATVINTTNTAVTWTVSNGTISSAGSFVAPTVTSKTTMTVTATSVADTTKTATATVTVSTTTVQPISMEVLYPPTTPFQAYYADVQTYLQSNPIVTGAIFSLEWGSADKGPTSNPQYDFSAFDATIAPWIAAGKKVNIVIWAVSDAPTNTATPTYVMSNLGASNITTCNGEQVPNYFQAVFQQPYQAFMAQVVQHYGNNGSIGYLRFGLGRGGETYPGQNFSIDLNCFNTFVNNWGWTDTNWINYLVGMMNYEATLNSPKQLGVGIDSVNSLLMPQTEAATAVSLGMTFGNEGLQLSDVLTYPLCVADWCSLFDQYAGQAPLELQTYLASNPLNLPPVGSLVTLLPFAIKRHTTVFELYTDDWLLAFDPNYPGYSTYGASYAQVLKATAAGR